MLKLTMLFEGNVFTSGWSEIWYKDTNDATIGMNVLKDISEVRRTILSSDFTLKYLRVSTNTPLIDPAPRPRQRSAKLLRVEQGEGQIPRGGGNDAGDLPFVAAKVRYLTSEANVFKPALLRGLPDSFWDADDKKALAQVNAFMKRYARALLIAQVGILHRVRGNPDTFSLKVVNDGQFLKMGKRDTGRPFYLARGRR